MISKNGNSKSNIFLEMHPLHRILLGLFASLITFLFIYKTHLDSLLIILMLWVSFALAFIASSAVVFFKLPVAQIVQKANVEDGSRIFVFISILISAFASMLNVLLLMLSNKMQTHEAISVIISVLGMMVSWVLVHTIFTFHYANIYYSKEFAEKTGDTPLIFPDTAKPDYLDFAYFSFVIGMTFQVSDVEIASQRIRRIALVHGLLSFTLNTFVVALTINLIAGLRN